MHPKFVLAEIDHRQFRLLLRHAGPIDLLQPLQDVERQIDEKTIDFVSYLEFTQKHVRPKVVERLFDHVHSFRTKFGGLRQILIQALLDRRGQATAEGENR